MTKQDFVMCAHFENDTIRDLAENAWISVGISASSFGSGKFGKQSFKIGSSKRYFYTRDTLDTNWNNNSQFTISFWFKKQSAGDGWTVVLGGMASETNPNYYISIQLTDYQNSYPRTRGFALGNADSTYADNKWHHMAICQNQNGIAMYVDGVKQRTSGNAVSVNFSKISIGAWVRSSYEGITAFVDDICILNTCLWTENFTPPTDYLLPEYRMGLIKSTQPINLLDKTSITGINATGIEPANTSRRLIFQVDGTWNKLTTDSLGSASLTALSEQNITVDSVLLEGNTVAELDEVTSVPGFAGKLIYPAAALYASADATVMPTLGLTIDGEIDTTVNVYEYTDYSQEYVLGDSDVTIVSAVAETTTTGSGAVTITARLYQNGEWSEYMSLNAVQMQQASKIQLKALYTVQTTSGADSVHIDAVTITYNTAGAVVSDATTDIVTVTERFENDLAYVHAYAKHDRLVDAEIEAYCSLRKQPHQRAMYQVGNGTGALATYQLPDTGVNQDTLQVYVDGKPNYDFGYNTETSQITVTADLGAVVSASYEYGWEPSTWVQMTKGSTQINDSGLCTTEYTYAIPTHSETYTVTAVKYSLVRPEGTVTNETIGVGTGKRQIIQLPHYAKTETIVCNGSWSYDYDSKRLTIIAPEGEDIVISYDWIAETPHVYGIAAGWAETIE